MSAVIKLINVIQITIYVAMSLHRIKNLLLLVDHVNSLIYMYVYLLFHFIATNVCSLLPVISPGPFSITGPPNHAFSLMW